MSLEKASIQPLDKKGNSNGLPIEVLFNPAEYSIVNSNQFQSTGLPGSPTFVTEFVSKEAQTLTMDLFFDTYTYKNGIDVRIFTNKLTALLDIDGKLHTPPVCKFRWGRLEFKAVLERVTQRFTMFLESGIPVRATLSVTFRECETLTERRGNLQSADRTKQQMLKQGDSLWLIADREYDDPGLWRPIADANKIANPRILEVGKEIVIPPLD